MNLSLRKWTLLVRILFPPDAAKFAVRSLRILGRENIKLKLLIRSTQYCQPNFLKKTKKNPHLQTGFHESHKNRRRVAQPEAIDAGRRVAAVAHLEPRRFLVAPPALEVRRVSLLVPLVHVRPTDASWPAVQVLRGFCTG